MQSKAANPNDVAKFQEIEGIIDEKQKSGSKEMISLFENAPVSQLKGVLEGNRRQYIEHAVAPDLADLICRTILPKVSIKIF